MVVREITPSLTPFEQLGLLLRDVFIADDFNKLSQALNILVCFYNSNYDDTETPPLITSQDTEYDFNSLFVGPDCPTAPPYSSVYLEKSGLLMGETTLNFREFMQSLGIYIRTCSGIPDDHIAYELEFTVLLSVNARNNTTFEVVLTHFFSEHLDKWLPPFIVKMVNNTKTVPLQWTAKILRCWLNELRMRRKNERL